MAQAWRRKVHQSAFQLSWQDSFDALYPARKSTVTHPIEAAERGFTCITIASPAGVGRGNFRTYFGGNDGIKKRKAARPSIVNQR